MGGTGLDRLQGHFGGDTFYASFTEDVFVGEYGRFTFEENPSGEQATFVISLAQGNLDLIRMAQFGLFTSFAQQVFDQSDLGEVARSRTVIATEFSGEAEEALGRLLALAQGGSAAGPGVDIVLPTAPTAAGIPVEGEALTDGEEQEEVCVENEDGFCEPVEEAGVEAEAVSEDEKVEQPQEATSAEANDSPTGKESSGINLETALAGFGGWAVMKAGKSSEQKKRKRDNWEQE
ncbi:hypothetical protein [Aliamphritea ceti]|uniref:hypothetical protein n=1 Tax=Aliamphritea ceti TaxID=1524258 RepID=UPI0021C2BAF9|nr:hypothetical protein [Aliamphritea ceti]